MIRTRFLEGLILWCGSLENRGKRTYKPLTHDLNLIGTVALYKDAQHVRMMVVKPDLMLCFGMPS